jgi:hypothetical protein
MPRYVEMSIDSVLHESDIFGAALPPQEAQGPQTTQEPKEALEQKEEEKHE